MSEFLWARPVKTERASRHTMPLLNQDWSNLEKLRWKAAVILMDAQAPQDFLTVELADFSVDGRPREAYDIGSPFGSYGVGTGFLGAWSFLNGIEWGLRMAAIATTAPSGDAQGERAHGDGTTAQGGSAGESGGQA